MGWVYVGVAVAVPLVIAVIGDLAARRSGRPVQIDPSLIKLRKKTLRKRGHGIGGTRQEKLNSFDDKWDAAERPRRLND